SEKAPTLHLVIPYKQFLINLSNDTDDKQLIFPVKKYIGEELENYWVVEDVHYVATMLHPNLKSFNYTPQQKYHAETLLKLEFEKHQQLEQRISLSNNNNNTSSSNNIFDLPLLSHESPDGEEIKTELDKYMDNQKKMIKI
ncbi:unnamed protein product, partial [Rotaria socialis]